MGQGVRGPAPVSGEVWNMKRLIVAALLAVMGVLASGAPGHHYHHYGPPPKAKADMYAPQDMYTAPADMYGAPHDMY